MNAPPDKVFWAQDGRVVNNLKELELALQDMSTETFRHHVNRDKNDFANWTEQVLDEKTLGRLMRLARTKDNMKRLVKKRLEEERHMKKKPKTPDKKAVKKSAKKTKKSTKSKRKKTAVPDVEFKSKLEPANHHVALAAYIALGIVLGSAVTLLALMAW